MTLTLFAQPDDKNVGMEFSELTLPQQVAAHEIEVHALRNEVHRLQKLIASLIDLVEQPGSSPESIARLRTLLLERERIRPTKLP